MVPPMTPAEMDHYWERFFAARSNGEFKAPARELTKRYPDDPGALTLGEMVAMALSELAARPRRRTDSF